MDTALLKPEKTPLTRSRRRLNFSYSDWQEVLRAVENGQAEHVVEFRDISEYYTMDDLHKQYSSFTEEERRRFRIARIRKGLSTWYWAVLMKIAPAGQE